LGYSVSSAFCPFLPFQFFPPGAQHNFYVVMLLTEGLLCSFLRHVMVAIGRSITGFMLAWLTVASTISTFQQSLPTEHAYFYLIGLLPTTWAFVQL
jgi:hypothetical protein